MLTVPRKSMQECGRLEQSEKSIVSSQSPEERRDALRVHLPAGAGESRDVLDGKVLRQMVDELCYIEEAFKGVRHGGDGDSGGGGGGGGSNWCV